MEQIKYLGLDVHKAMTSAVGLDLRTPSRKVRISSPITSQLFRRRQRGQPLAWGAS